MPVSLDGVSVRINGKPAYVGYVSAEQINVVAPADATIGPVDVVVTYRGNASAAVSVPLNTYSPGLFQWGVPGVPHAIAQHYPDLQARGTPAAPVRPGDVIILWATGLGPTNPPQSDGMKATVGRPVAAPVTLRLTGRAIPIIGAAHSEFAGDYQISLTVPADTPDGDLSIVVSVGGVSSPDAVFLNVKR